MSISNSGAISKIITFANTTSLSLGFLPPNSIITGIKVLVGTAFNAGGADVIDVGDDTTANKFANDVNVASTGSATVTLDNVGAVESSTASTEIKAIYVPAGSTPTAGSGYIVVEYEQL